MAIVMIVTMMLAPLLSASLAHAGVRVPPQQFSSRAEPGTYPVPAGGPIGRGQPTFAQWVHSPLAAIFAPHMGSRTPNSMSLVSSPAYHVDPANPLSDWVIPDGRG